MNKLKKSLSVLLTLVMLFTTFCFFPLDLGAVEADAAIAGIKIVVPETLYLTPSTGASTTIQYYINNTADGSVSASQDTSAKVHITYPGAKLTSVSAKTSAAITLPASITGLVGTTFGSSATTATGTFSLPAGLNAGSTALVEWTFVFDVNGKTQTHYAYSVAYAPWYQPVGAAAKAKGAYHNTFASSILWVSGVHGYSDGDSNSRWYIQTANFIPMLGTITAPGNNNPDTNWIQSGSNGLSATINYQSVEAGGVKYHARANSISPTANLTVDTSRYSNFNQIPNFSVGFMVTDRENANEGPTWYVSDFTGETSSYYNGTDTGSSEYSGDFNSSGTKFSSGDDTSTGIKYNGTWNKAISGTASFRIKSAVKTKTNKVIDTTAWNNNFVNISVTGANKSTLRANVLNGTTYAKENYTTDTWNTYYSALKTAATNLCNPTSATVDTSALTNAEAGLHTTVYFDANGGALGSSTPASLALQIGSADSLSFNNADIVGSFNATRTGYTFLGWSTEKGATTAPESFTIGFNDTIYAVWKANTYDVVFDNMFNFNAFGLTGALDINERTETGFTVTSTAEDGNTGFSAAMPVTPGKTYVLKADVQFESVLGGYDMYVHTLDSNQAGETTAVPDTSNGAHREGNVYISLTGQTTNTTPYIRFTAGDNTAFIKIRFDANAVGNKLTVNNIRIYEEGKVADGVSYAAPYVATYDSTYALPTPTRENYAFAGWYTTPVGDGTKYSTGDTVKITDTLYLYSRWTDANYYIAFDANTGNGEMATVKANIGENFTLPANTFTKTGYHFVGWSTDKSATAGTYADKAGVQLTDKVSTVTLYAVWAKNDYTINYVGGDGATGNTAPQAVKYDETVAIRTNGFSKTGYIFSGWTDGTTTYAAGQEVKNLTADNGGTITLTAVWTPINYTVYFDIPGATIVPLTVTYDENAGRLPDGSVFSKEGYTFGGWVISTTGTVVNADNYDTLVTVDGGSVTLKAVENENSYTVKYLGNGATGGATADQSYKFTDNVIISANGYTKTGYHFVGWATTENGEAEYIAGTENISALTAEPDGVVELYAVWEANTYTVKFNNNDAAATGTMDDMTFTYDAEAKALAENKYNKTGYHFLGWSKDSTATTATYADMEEVRNLTAEENGVVTLYAVWEINTYEVTFNYKNVDGTDAILTLPAVEHGTEFASICPKDVVNVYYLSSDRVNHFEFVAWDKDEAAITSDIVYTATYTAVAHTMWEDVEHSVPAKCEVPGVYAEVCDYCGFRCQKDTPALEHKYVDVAGSNTATCTEDGTIAKTCSECQKTIVTESKAFGHTEKEAVKENIKPAECTVDGSYDLVVYCETCNSVVSKQTVTVDATGHAFGEITAAVAPGCTTVGNSAYKSCAVCNKFFASDADNFSVEAHNSEADFVIGANGHNTVVVPAVAPDCENDGNHKYYTCNNCELLFSDKEGTAIIKIEDTVDAKLGHDYGELIAKDEATCEEAGTKAHYKCSRCDKLFDEEKNEVTADALVIEAKGHEYGTLVPKVEATCVREGVKAHYTCSVCSKHFDENKVVLESLVIAKNNNHSLATVAAKAPTCENFGWAEYQYCIREGCTYTEYVELPKLGHNYVGEITTNPTCTKKGEKTFTCQNDSTHTYKEAVDALGHTFNDEDKVAYVAPQCTTDGNEAYKKCAVCELYFEDAAEVNATNGVANADAFVIPQTGHNYVAVITSPTCTKGGYTTHTCNACGHTYQDATVDARGHESGEPVFEKDIPASCLVDGSYQEVVYCKVCEEELSRVDKVHAAPGHNEAVRQENIQNATCTVAGSYDNVTYCTVCKAVIKTETVSDVKLPHTYEEKIVDAAHLKQAATCYSLAVYYYDCLYCDATRNADYTFTDGTTLEHTPADEAVTEDFVDSTCYQEGSYNEVVYCSVCDAAGIKTVYSTTKIVVEKKAHTPGAVVVENEKDPTCYQKGSYDNVTYCSVCEAANKGMVETSRKTILVPMVAHTPAEAVEENIVAPKCEENGSHDEVVYCSVCAAAGKKFEISRETVTDAMTGHVSGTYTENIDEDAGNCMTDATWIEVTYCNACHKERSRENKTGEGDSTIHTGNNIVKKEDVVPGTCTSEETWNDVTYCECGAKVKTEAKTGEKDAANHSGTPTKLVNEKAPTCKDEGYTGDTLYSCCDELYAKGTSIPTTDHTPDEAVIENEVKVTCTADGSYDEVVYCAVCDTLISSTHYTVASKGHTPGDVVYENETPATETTNGQRDEVVYCTVCNAEISRTTVVTKVERTITFVMYDKTVSVKAYTGDAVTSPIVSAYTTEDGFIHVFKDWDRPVETVTGDTTYTAVYTQPCDYSEIDALEKVLGEILDGGLADEEELEANRDEIEKVLAQIEEIKKDKNTRDESEQNEINAVVDRIEILIDTIYPDAGSTLTIVGASTFYTGTILDLKAVKISAGSVQTVVNDAVWTSSDENIVFFSNGKLYAIGTGTVTLTATRGILKASKTITVVTGGNTRGINFTSIDKTHFIIEDYMAVYNSAIIYWSDDYELRFRVRVYQNFMFEDYIVYINGVEVEPDENGYYTIPAGSGDARVTIAGAIVDTGAGEGEVVTKWSFWEWLLNLFRKIVAFFTGGKA